MMNGICGIETGRPASILCRAFSPRPFISLFTQPYGLGWDMAAPLALNFLGYGMVVPLALNFLGWDMAAPLALNFLGYGMVVPLALNRRRGLSRRWL